MDATDQYFADHVASSTEQALSAIFGQMGEVGVAAVDALPGIVIQGRYCTPNEVRVNGEAPT